jgi:serine/threonine-protein kinase PpkA
MAAPEGVEGAREARSKRKITRHLRILGTPEYMAPEQILGRSLDERVDLYAVGVMLFTLLIGQLPFRGDDRIALYEAHLRTAVPSLNDYMMASPQAIEERQGFFERALAKLPDQRFPDARTMRRALVKLPRVNFLSG